jgi:hypothetical protein
VPASWISRAARTSRPSPSGYEASPPTPNPVGVILSEAKDLLQHLQR